MAHPQDVQPKATENFTFYLYLYNFSTIKLVKNSLWLVAWTLLEPLLHKQLFCPNSSFNGRFLYQDFLLSWFCCCCFGLLYFSFLTHSRNSSAYSPSTIFALSRIMGWIFHDLEWLLSNAHMTNIVFTWLSLRGPSDSPLWMYYIPDVFRLCNSPLWSPSVIQKYYWHFTMEQKTSQLIKVSKCLRMPFGDFQGWSDI